MKLAKRLMAIIVAMVMVLAMGAVVFADEDAGSDDKVTITVNRDKSYASMATGTREFTYYKVFDASYTGTGEAESASYTASATIAAKIQSVSALADYYTLTSIAGSDAYTVSWKGDGSAERVQAAAALLLENKVYTETGALTPNEAGTVWAATVSKGYYILSSSEGANLIAATTDIDINEKNTYPTIEKEQRDEDRENYSHDEVKLAVGDTVDYQITVKIPVDVKAGQYVSVIDTMTNGLTYTQGVDGLSISGLTKGTDYTALAENDPEYAAGAAWQIKILPNSNTLGKTLTIKFTATITDAALVDTGRQNTVELKYDNQHYVQNDHVNYTTYFTGVRKVDSKDNAPLEGVKFTLKEAGVEFKVTKTTDGYYVPDAAGTSEVVTNEDGLIKIRGLDADKTYTLTETYTLPGYNKLENDVTLTLTKDEGEAFANKTADAYQQVENSKGSLLPSTGGMGTTLFYVIGGVLVLLAAVLIISKKRVRQ